MSHRILIPMMVVALLLAGCAAGAGSGQNTADSVARFRLPMGYIPSVQYAPFYVADALGYYEDAGIEIEFDYSTETDGMALVGAGELPFSLVSGEQVLLARAQGLPVVNVLGWWQDYPVAVASFSDKGIRKPEDLAGKKLGLPGLFGANYIGLRALLNHAGLSEDDLTLDSIGFNQVEALVAGREDGIVIYANNEPIQLEHLGYSVDIIRVADYVHLASNGLITNEATLTANPELVRRMVQATIKGVAFTLESPDEAFAICANYVEGLKQGDQVVQRAILDASMEFWKADKLGASDRQAWENMQTVLLDMGMLVQPLDLDAAFTNRFVLEK